MTRRAIVIAVLFLAANGVLLGLWTARTRQRLEDVGRPDAVALAEFVEQRETDELSTEGGREDLTALVAERGLRGARVLDPSGGVLLTVGEAPGPKVQSVVEAVPNSSLRVIALVDRAPIDAEWRTVRRRAVVAACVALVFAPLFGFLLGRLTNRG